MKKLVSLLLAMILVLSLVPAAVADQVMLNPDENRKIKLQKVGLNEAEEGVSPTTGLYLEDLEAPAGFAGLAVTGRYMPMLVQIDNTSGGIDARAPWGASFADIVYETETYNGGYTRYTAVFNDTIPDQIEAIRSARIVHADIYSEYNGAYPRHSPILGHLMHIFAQECDKQNHNGK